MRKLGLTARKKEKTQKQKKLVKLDEKMQNG